MARRPRSSRASAPALDSLASGGWLAAFVVLAALLHLGGHSQRPLWLDEACTYWTIHVPASDLLRGLRTDGSPPAYFLLVRFVTGLLGYGELALRMVSVAAATALVFVVHRVTLLFATRRTALIAAGLAAISPLAHHYATEARFYSLLQLETLVVIYSARRASLEPERARWWTLLGAAHAIQLWTHHYALFLLPVPALVLLVTGGRSGRRLALRAGAAAAVAFATYLPWFLAVARGSSAGVGDWIVPIWNETPPYAAVFRSLEIFGFGGSYPYYLLLLGQAPSLRAMSLAITFGLIAVAALCPWPCTERGDGGQRAARALVGFLLLPLLLAWLYSSVGQPVYVAGRYDSFVLPVFLIVLAVGLDQVLRRSVWAGRGLIGMILALAAYSLSPIVHPFPTAYDVLAARYLASQAAPSDRMVTTGTRRAVVSYYLDRAGSQFEVVSFPAEIAGHPGWYSAQRLLNDREALAREGDRVTAGLAAQSPTVWLLASPPNEVDLYLARPLAKYFSVDEGRSRREWGLICMTPRQAAGRTAAR